MVRLTEEDWDRIYNYCEDNDIEPDTDWILDRIYEEEMCMGMQND